MMKKIYETLCKLLLQIEVPLQQTTTENYYKLRHIYYKLQQKNITNYIKNLLQIAPAQISSNYWWLLQIVLIFVTNYNSFQNYYNLRQKLVLQLINENVAVNFEFSDINNI